jgi:hypothetical protein
VGVVCVDVTAEHLPAIRQLLMLYWERTWPTEVADRFLRWRLLDRPDWAAVAAFDGDRCVAFIDSFVRPYTIDGRSMRVRETGEWFCLPEHRPLASLRVLQALMKKPEPIIAITNSEVTKAVLPKLKWQVVCEQQQRVFPAGVGVAVKGLTKRLKTQLSALPAFTGTLLPFRFRKPRRLEAPEQPASVREITSADDLPDLQPPEDSFALYALAGREDARWFSAAPSGEGRFIWLQFALKGETVGLSLSRIFREGPYQAARLLHIQSTRHDPETYAWMASETSCHVAADGVHWIEARSTSDMIIGALESTGYIKGNTFPVYWWPGGDRVELDGNIFLNGMRGEEALMPYPA